jgi:hypothetical protein
MARVRFELVERERQTAVRCYQPKRYRPSIAATMTHRGGPRKMRALREPSAARLRVAHAYSRPASICALGTRVAGAKEAAP